MCCSAYLGKDYMHTCGQFWGIICRRLDVLCITIWTVIRLWGPMLKNQLTSSNLSIYLITINMYQNREIGFRLVMILYDGLVEGPSRVLVRWLRDCCKMYDGDISMILMLLAASLVPPFNHCAWWCDKCVLFLPCNVNVCIRIYWCISLSYYKSIPVIINNILGVKLYPFRVLNILIFLGSLLLAWSLNLGSL